ncbi:DoxX family protein [Georgenia yuyongxinii]
MTLVSPLARPLLAATFVADGVDAVLHPDAHTEKFHRVKPALDKVGVPAALTADPRMLARVSGAVSAVCGLMLATGRKPRTAALTLAVLNIPVTVLNNPVWDAQDRRQRKHYVAGLLRGLSIGGGLLFAAAYRGGKPSWGWRLENAREHRAQVRAATEAVRERYKA